MKLIFPRLCGAIPFLQGGCFYAEQMFAGGGALLLVLMLCLSLFAGALAENADAAATGETSKSKSATNLDSNYETTVTLSFPSAQVSLDSDVVFVLDKSTSAEAQDAALEMLKSLQGQLTGTGAKINVAVVLFNKEAHSTGWLDLATKYSEIETALKEKISSGTNCHAGLLKAKELLQQHKNISNDRKYLIFVSDGITYIFNSNPTVVAWQFRANSVASFAGPDNWNSKYGSNEPPADWDAWLNDIGKKIDKQSTTYDYPYEGTPTNYTDVEKNKDYANSIDKALYLTAQVYKECLDTGYRCYALTADQNKGTGYLWGPSFMSYLADIRKKDIIIEKEIEDGNGNVIGSTEEVVKEDGEIDFSYIGDDILYMLGSGSGLIDYIGDDFDLVADSIVLKVGNTKYQVGDSKHPLEKKTIIMKGYDTENTIGTSYRAYQGEECIYQIDYYPSANPFTPNGECIVLTIYTNVTNFQRVELSYKLKLTNPKTTAGTYGQYDQYGENGYDALYTNNSAVLHPMDSHENRGEDEYFNKPTVSYTVYAPTETTPPSGDIDVPQTGDSTPLVLLAALMVLSAAGVAVILKRQRAHR